MIFINDVIRLRGSLIRILHIERDQVWGIDVSAHDVMPRMLPLPFLKEQERKGELKREAGPRAIHRDRASAAAVARKEQMWGYIQPLVKDQRIYDKSFRSAAIKQMARTAGVAPQTLYSALRRYWQNGMTADALLPEFHKCGSKTGMTSSRGRRPNNPSTEVFQMNDEQYTQLERFVRRTYLKQDTMTACAAYQRYLQAYFTYLDGNGGSYIKPPGERPSLRQFTYAMHRLFSHEDKIRGRKGHIEFQRNHRSKLGSVQIDCLGAGHFYEIDATIADVHLVSRHDRKHLIGKPTLYLIIDRFTRLIVGFYIGFEAPSWVAAKLAIMSIFENKKELCQGLGVNYNADDWPADGVAPQQFLADRGEMMAQASDVLVGGLNITVANLPSCRPDHKPLVEGALKLIHQRLASSIPGYEPSENFNKRRAKHYDTASCLTLEEFRQAILLSIITHNRKVMKKYPVTPEMITDSVIPTPVNLWNYSVEQRMGRLSRLNEDDVRFALLPQGDASVSREGIQFKGCTYTCSEAVKRSWYVTGSHKTMTLRVSYDERCVNTIYLHDPMDPSGYIQAQLLKKSQAFRDLSFNEVAHYQKQHKLNLQGAEQENLQNAYEFHKALDPMVRQAQKATQDASRGVRRGSRLRDKDVNRELERRAERLASTQSSKPDALPAREPLASPIPIKQPRPNPSFTQGESLDDLLQQLQEDVCLNENPT